MDELAIYRKLFPVTGRCAYLDHAGLGPTSRRVATRIRSHLDELAEHGVARVEAWEERAEATRAAAARLLGAEASEIAFVRNTSHGLSLVAAGLRWEPGDNLLCASGEEYPSNVYPWQRLGTRGVELRGVPAPGGRVEVEAFAKAGDERTRLVAVSSVQYASGFRVDLPELGRLCSERGWVLAVDAIQSVGCIPEDVKAAGVHFLAADSHKWMLGLPGIGLLYVDRGRLEELDPVLVGWKSVIGAWDFDRRVEAAGGKPLPLRTDAKRFEEGSSAYALIEGLGAAIELLLEVGMDRIWRRIRSLNEHLAHRLEEDGHAVTSPLDETHRSGSLCFRPRRGDPAALVERLQGEGVLVSCRRGQVRVSPHFYNLESELDRVVEAAGT